MASGSGSNQASKPVFAQGQRDAAGAIVNQILIPALFGGAPDVATQQSINRAQMNYQDQAARQGLDPRSGLYQKGQVELGKAGVYADTQKKWDYINRIFQPLGQGSIGQSTSVGLGS